MSPATLDTYAAAAKGLDAFFAERGMPRSVVAITRATIMYWPITISSSTTS